MKNVLRVFLIAAAMAASHVMGASMARAVAEANTASVETEAPAADLQAETAVESAHAAAG